MASKRFSISVHSRDAYEKSAAVYIVRAKNKELAVSKLRSYLREKFPYPSDTDFVYLGTNPDVEEIPDDDVLCIAGGVVL